MQNELGRTNERKSGTACTARFAVAVLGCAVAAALTACGGSDGSSQSSGLDPGAGMDQGPAIPPIATDSCEDLAVEADGTVAGSLAKHATSPQGRGLTYSIVAGADSGSVVLDAATGAFTYERRGPGRGEFDRFKYRVTDTAGMTAEATATLIYGARRIMPLGDSITAGVEGLSPLDEPLPPNAIRVGYRKPLKALLSGNGFAVDLVGTQDSGGDAQLADDEHEGHPGAGQLKILAEHDAWFDAVRPDIVLLHIGTNDHGSTSTEVIDELLASLRDKTLDPAYPAMRVLLSTIIDKRWNPPDVAEFNANLKAMYDAKWRPANNASSRFIVDMVDMFSSLSSLTDLSDQQADPTGLHPNTAGYAKMADVWTRSLIESKALNKCP
jgi:lysophospholipase L1-like esterase